MPVTTTPRDILLAAYGKSTQNLPGDIATEAAELLQVVIRAMRGIYAAAARVNPYFFAEIRPDVAYDASRGGWPRPEAAESVFRIEGQGSPGGRVPAGTEVVVVPLEDRTAEVGLPAVYRLGQVYRPAGNPADPNENDALTFMYAKRPDDPAGLDSPLDPLWTEQFNELLVLEVAIYLALKDERMEEVQALKQERAPWITSLVAFLQHETANERRRYGAVRYINTSHLYPLLAGGEV